jgi:RNA polymerase sigma factor (sigma-70 family)
MGRPRGDLANHLDISRAAAVTDAELVDMLRAGDTMAQTAAWARVGLLARRIVGRFFGPGLDPADMVQEVFVRLFARLDELDDPENLRPFVIGIALGVARNQARSARIRRLVGLTATGNLPDVAVGAADMEAREAVRRFYKILDGVNAQSRSLFVARFLEKLEMVEIATAHGLSLGTAKRRMARAVDHIGRRISHDQVLATYLTRVGGFARVGGLP